MQVNHSFEKNSMNWVSLNKKSNSRGPVFNPSPSKQIPGHSLLTFYLSLHYCWCQPTWPSNISLVLVRLIQKTLPALHTQKKKYKELNLSCTTRGVRLPDLQIFQSIPYQMNLGHFPTPCTKSIKNKEYDWVM